MEERIVTPHQLPEDEAAVGAPVVGVRRPKAGMRKSEDFYRGSQNAPGSA